MIEEIERAIHKHLERGRSRSDLIVYVSHSLRLKLIADCERVSGFRQAKDETEMILGCEMRELYNMHEPFAVIDRRHLKGSHNEQGI